MNKVIIGIHGLANKPQRKVLFEYWHKALQEGLANVDYIGDIPFYLVYWADLLYKNPLHICKDFDFDTLFNDEPYVPAEPSSLRTYSDSWTDEARSAGSAIAGKSLDFLKNRLGVNRLADWVLQKCLKDLAFYYDEKRKLRDRDGIARRASDVLRDELLDAIRKHRDKKIMIIAHSMGSIIAYDTLRNVGQSQVPEDDGLLVPYFVTIGSPLGLPHVKGKIIEERKYDGETEASRVRTPSIVTTNWVNYSDRKDPVAADVHIHDDYQANANNVRVADDLVENDYRAPPKPGQNRRERNHHKSYGYLRVPELSLHVKEFLQQAE